MQQHTMSCLGALTPLELRNNASAAEAISALEAAAKSVRDDATRYAPAHVHHTTHPNKQAFDFPFAAVPV